MRVLVTGASGFLGRRLMPLLGGHEVLSLVHPADLPRPTDGVREVVGDLSCEGGWQDEVLRFAPEWCIHLAWEGLPDYSLVRCRVNVDSTLRLLQTLVAAHVRRVIVAGSCWEYGQAAGPVAEDLTPVGYGIFAATKHAIRMMLDSVSREAGFEYRWARIFFVYGPGQRPTSLIPHLRASYAAGERPTLREPHVVQDFVHVDDVARGLVSLARCDAPSGIFNLGSGRPVSVGCIANMVASHFGKPAPFEPAGGGPGFWADPGFTLAASGWRAGIEIADGVARTLAALDGAA
jgi:UDP-glucose 4-epimerase